MGRSNNPVRVCVCVCLGGIYIIILIYDVEYVHPMHKLK